MPKRRVSSKPDFEPQKKQRGQKVFTKVIFNNFFMNVYCELLRLL